MTTNYFSALADHNAAIEAFHAVRDAYRAGNASDEEFLAARAAYDQATAKFDAAYDEEAAR